MPKSASIQPRTSLSKFGRKFNSLFIRLLIDAVHEGRDELRVAAQSCGGVRAPEVVRDGFLGPLRQGVRGESLEVGGPGGSVPGERANFTRLVREAGWLAGR